MASSVTAPEPAAGGVQAHDEDDLEVPSTFVTPPAQERMTRAEPSAGAKPPAAAEEPQLTPAAVPSSGAAAKPLKLAPESVTVCTPAVADQVPAPPPPLPPPPPTVRK